MAMLNDFECLEHGTFEAWDNTATCPTCEKPARRLIGKPGIVLNFKDEGFPRAWRRWAEQHERPVKRLRQI